MNKTLQKFWKKLIFLTVAFFVLTSNLVSGSTGEDLDPVKYSGLVSNIEENSGKIESSLYQMQKRLERSQASAPGLNVKEDKVRVVIELRENASQDSLAAIETLGGDIETTYQNLVQAMVPVSQLSAIADLSFIKVVRPPNKPNFDVISEGVGVIKADLVNAAGYTGQGVKVAVIDCGFDITNPEISGNIVESKSFRSDGDITGRNPFPCYGGEHGTATAEIVVDVAPDVSLYLYNFGTDVEWYNAVDYAVSQGADIISHSISWFNKGNYDGTSPIAQKVDSVRQSGILWVNSAGNYAKKHWEGTFTDIDNNRAHEFTTSPIDEYNEIYAVAGYPTDIYLSWDDWGTSPPDQDLNLYLLNSTGDVIARSENRQNGSGYPYPTEHIKLAPYTGTYYIIIQNRSITRNVYIELYSSYNDLEHNISSSSLASPADSDSSLTVGATYWNGDVLEDFSSQGPTNDGRTKPDVTAPDGTSSSVYGLSTGDRNADRANRVSFFGTSASAPHVAGAAALLLEQNPSLSPDQIQTLLEDNAVDLGIAGKDNQTGAGRIDVYASLSQSPPSGGQTQIDSCGTLSTAGETYVLQNDISATGTCFTIGADDIILDGAGYSITGDGSGYDYGVHLSGTSGVTVKNLNVSGFWRGIRLDSSSNNTISNNTVNLNNGSGIAILSSSSNNTITDNTVNLNNGSGIAILSSSSNNTITDNTVNLNNGSGIDIEFSSNNNTLINNTASNNNNGISLYYSSYNTITGNTARSNNDDGIYFLKSNSNTITNNTASSNNNNGIRLGSSSNNTLTGNTASSNNDDGIYLSSSSSNTLTGNTASSNNNFGIYLSRSSNNTLTGNTASSNNDDGIYLSSSSSNTLTGNTASSNNDDGIYLSSSSSNTLTGNTASSNNDDGIVLGTSSSNTLTGNTANLNNYGIYLHWNCNDNTITNNTANLNNYGIYLHSSGNNTITNNVIDDSVTSGFYFLATNSYYNTIKDNTINGDTYYHLVNEDGIVLENLVLTTEKPSNLGWVSVINSTNVTLRNLTLANNTGYSGLFLYKTDDSSITNVTSYSNYYGIRLYYSSSNTLIGNTMSANTYNFYIYGSSVSYYVQTIDISNTVDGRPIYYLVGVSDRVIDPSTNAGFVGVVNSVNVTVRDLTLTNNSHGVLFVNATDSSILNVYVPNNYYGISLYSSGSNTITGNTAKENNNHDVYVSPTSDADCNNVVKNNTGSGNRPIKYFNYSVSLQDEVLSELILCNADNSNINNVTIKGAATKKNNALWVIRTDNSSFTNINSSNNKYGIYLSSSSSNTLTGNTANSNNRYGIRLYSSSGNTLTGNNANSNNWYGISLYDSSSNTFTGNNANSNNWDGIHPSSIGIRLDYSSSNTLTGNNASNNEWGIILYSSSSNTLTDNNANSNNYDGINLYYSSSNTLTDNNASSNNQNGIDLSSSSSNTLTGNTANSNNYDGIDLSSSSGNTLTGNTASDNEWGIILYSSSSNTIYLSNFIDNGNNVYSSSSTNFWNSPELLSYTYNGSNYTNYLGNSWSDYSGSDADGEGIGDIPYSIGGDNDSYPLMERFEDYEVGPVPPGGINCGDTIYTDTTLTDDLLGCTGNGLIIGADGITLDGAGYSITGNESGNGVYLNGRSGVTVKNLNVNGFSTGIRFYRSSSNILTNNAVTSNVEHGIKLNLSDSNTIAGNTVNSNKKGIRLFTSNYNTVTNNIVEYSNRSGIKLNATSTYNNLSNNIASNNNKNGIVLAVGSDYNTISNNAVNSNNKSGIRVKFASNYNNITDNTANSNTLYGIYPSSSSNNLVYNNYFNNTNNFALFSSTNDWNTTKIAGINIIIGPYLGGNFWAYPNGTGFSETCTDADGDGICDSGYTLALGNVDHLPLTFNTPSGTNVSVGFAEEGTNITFANVTEGGQTSVNISTTGPSPPDGFNLSGSYYDITTTANYTGDITICINYNESQVDNESTLGLLHYENGSWTDVTTSLDTNTNIICGDTTSLSPFIVAEPIDTTPPETFNITLLQDWNLISLPLEQDNWSITSVLAPIDSNYSVVFAYINGGWKKSTAARNPLTNISLEYGYWIYMTAPDTLELTGTVPPTTTINVSTGWNLAGYPSLATQNITTVLSPVNYTVVFAYINGTWKKSTAARNPLTEMAPGYGYWIYANEVGSYEVLN